MRHNNRKRLKGFREKIRNTNYTNTNSIVADFIDSLEDYKTFMLLKNGGDFENSSRKLKDSGTKSYRSMELAYKNFLHKKYKAQLNNGEITQSYCDSRVSWLTNKNTTHYDLKEEFLRLVVNTSIDVEMICLGTKNNNNNPKHTGEIPDPSRLRKNLFEISKFFKTYIDPKIDYPIITDSVLGDENAWLEMKNDCDNFDENNCYILITPEQVDVNEEAISSLFQFNWDLIIDFNPSSDTTGLESCYESITKRRGLIRDLSLGDSRRPIRVSATPYWVMANGYIDNPTSIMKKFNSWKSKYGQNLFGFLGKIYSAYTKPAKVMILQGIDEKILDYIVGEFNSAYLNSDEETSNVDFYLLSGANEYLDIEYDNFKRTALSYNEFVSRLGKRNVPIHKASTKRFIPSFDGGKELEPDFLAKFSDFAEVVYRGIEYSDDKYDEYSDPSRFYDGSYPISWQGLIRRDDIVRTVYETSYTIKLRRVLKEKPRTFFTFDYLPGHGGTTQLRRIAWDFHFEYPVIIVRNYNSEQKSKFSSLFNICKLPLLILVDSNDMSKIEVADLRDDLQAENFSHVLCYFNRNEQTRITNLKNPDFVLGNLSPQETGEMCNKLIPYVCNEICKENLLAICNETEDSESRSPFIMALMAMDQNFKGVKPYIKNYLNPLNEDTKRLLVYVALADFANEYLDFNFFEELFQNPNVNDEFLSEIGAFRMLVTIIKRGPKKQYCKMKYHRFAEELLIQVSTGPDGLRIRYMGLLDYILRFIEDSRPSQFAINQDTVTLLRTLFITRIEDAEARPSFATIVQNIYNEERDVFGELSQAGLIAIGSIFSKLVEVYPEEPHFLAHLARFNYYIEKDYKNGFKNINKAIELNEGFNEEQVRKKDPLLYHMKAMGYTAEITNKLIPEIRKFKNNQGDAELKERYSELLTNVLKAQELFEDVRKIGKRVAGHISDINLCLSIIELGKYMSGNSDTAKFIRENSDSWYMQFVDLACNLFDECSQYDNLKDFESKAILEIEPQIQILKGNLAKTIDLWESYLSSVPEIDKPRIRRMLARSYEENNIVNNQNNLQRVVDLMRQNILEEPQKSINIRIWFNAVRRLSTHNPRSILDDALIKLNQWVALSDSVDAHYYRFVLTYIKAVEGSIDAESRLPRLLADLKSRATNLPNRTRIQDWLGKEDTGIKRLIPYKNLSLSNENEAIAKLAKLSGRINEKYVNENHAYITAYQTDVFFNPSSTRNINRDLIKSRVEFCVGFSFDGPRAFNASVDLKVTSSEAVDELKPLEYGDIVMCEVMDNRLEHYINVRIVGYECQGSIHISELSGQFSNEHRPLKGTLMELMILKSKFVEGRGHIWELTMNINDQSDIEIELPEYKKKLLEVSSKLRDNNLNNRRV